MSRMKEKTYIMNDTVTIIDDRGDADLEKQIFTLKNRVKELEDINEGHRQLNGSLRVEIQTLKVSQSEHEKDKNLLQGYKNVINDLSARLRKYES
jgi:hypothetical protein